MDEINEQPEKRSRYQEIKQGERHPAERDQDKARQEVKAGLHQVRYHEEYISPFSFCQCNHKITPGRTP